MFKYSLNSKDVKKGKCPLCERNYKFTFYVNNETLEIIGDRFGKCDRVNSCRYHLKPDKDLIVISENYTPPPPRPISLIDYEAVKRSMNKSNNLIEFLKSNFDNDKVNEVIEKYKIGSSRYWEGSTVFWQIDASKRVRGGKIMLYNKETGRRIKRLNRSFIYWVHSAMKLKNYNLKQCFFGEHLINESNKPIAIVESEKTAIICDLVLGEYIWLATGSKQNLSFDKLNILNKKEVRLFPDNDAFNDWSKFNLPVSEILNNQGDIDGFDLADWILNKYST